MANESFSRKNDRRILIIAFIFCFEIFSGNQLSQQLENWLDKAELTYGPARAIIAPYV